MLVRFYKPSSFHVVILFDLFICCYPVVPIYHVIKTIPLFLLPIPHSNDFSVSIIVLIFIIHYFWYPKNTHRCIVSTFPFVISPINYSVTVIVISKLDFN